VYFRTQINNVEARTIPTSIIPVVENQEMIDYFNEQKEAAVKKRDSLENPTKEDIELIEELEKVVDKKSAFAVYEYFKYQ